MSQPVQRLASRGLREESSVSRDADRALLLERVAVGLAHEGKNPLHNMVLHVQLMTEKLADPDRQDVDRHLQALREGIGRVDTLLRCFGEFASPAHLPPDLGAALARTALLFQYETRRAGVQVTNAGPAALLVDSDPRILGDVVAHAYVAALEMARDGGALDARLDSSRAGAVLTIRSSGGIARREAAEPHLDAARRLAAPASCELSIELLPGGGARLSLNFLHAR